MELPLSPGGRRYGGRPSVKDSRDYGMARLPFTLARDVPTSFSLQYKCGPVRDQGQLGACTAFAGTAMREMLAYNSINQTTPVFSPLFLYYLERQKDGDLSQGDTGSTGRTCVQVLNQYGVCLEPTDPYNIAVFQTPPSVADIQEAAKYKAGAYHQITNLLDMKSAIVSGYGFIVGFTVYDSFESSDTASSGLMPVPDKSKEQILGGHEVYFMGYDDSVQCPGASTSGAFTVQNSWGTGWGESGFFKFPYECVMDSQVFSDAFLSHMGKAW